MARTYGIAELAEEFGVTTRTIRFYEDQGLIAPDREGHRRVYRPRDRVRLKLIMRGKRLGFSLDEIREMIDIYDVDRSEVSQLRLVLDKIVERRDALLLQQSDIAAMLRELGELQERCAVLLEHKKDGATPAPVEG
ncbi:MAG: MerR family DNA-binding transcriptional regulator [Rhodospirillales bacterium]|nr:MAG: MerR family DNA-binding transcriptional regulator [Rhodospirillales bacterium]